MKRILVLFVLLLDIIYSMSISITNNYHQISRKIGSKIDINIMDLINYKDTHLIDYLLDMIFKHGVILVESTVVLNNTELVELGSLLGIILPLPFDNTLHDGYITRVSNIDINNPNITRISNFGEDWHNDGDFRQNNRIINILQCHIPTEYNGYTGFFDLNYGHNILKSKYRDLYDALIDKQTKVDVRNISDFKTGLNDDLYTQFPVAYHDILNKHEMNGLNVVYYGHHKATINGYNSSYSEYLLNEIEYIMTNEQEIYKHKWNKGDILLWDNTQVMHRGMGNYGFQKRLLHRVQTQF